MSKQVFVNIEDIPKIITYEELYGKLKITKTPNLEYVETSVFWENLNNFGCREYVFISTKLIRNRIITKIEKRFKIWCKGGEYMPIEKPKLVFGDVSDIPKKHAGKTGYDIDALLSQIPDGKAWIISEEKVKGVPSIATVREYVKKHAKDYDAVQRTVDGKRFLYVSKVTEKA